MPISDNDYKLLWGRAAGMCSRPTCPADLTILLTDSRAYNVGEMAHIIAKQPSGPRGIEQGGSDTYENLILLCPTCHRKVDKAPEGEYPVAMLRSWKEQHELSIRAKGKQQQFDSTQALKKATARLLLENRALWKELGPQSIAASNDPGSNLHQVWDLRKLDTLVPNNQEIINTIEANINLLNTDEFAAFVDFKIHAGAFEANQYSRLDSYPTFPKHFGNLFEV